jgi:hypothetical protein
MTAATDPTEQFGHATAADGPALTGIPDGSLTPPERTIPGRTCRPPAPSVSTTPDPDSGQTTSTERPARVRGARQGPRPDHGSDTNRLRG